MKIEMLYLMDCPYCIKTKRSLHQAMKESGIKDKPVEMVIDSAAKVKRYKFRGSPTIRINGKDVQDIIKKHVCLPCSEASGKEVSCRTFNWRGKAYPYPPKAMIKAAIKEAMR